MRNIIRVNGFFGSAEGHSVEGSVQIRFSGAGMGERLSLAFHGRYKVDIPYRQVERLSVRTRGSAGAGNSGRTVERSAELDGYYSDETVRNRAGAVSVWFRRSSGFEMLTVAFEGCGQISVPFEPVARLAEQERGMRA